MQSAPALAARTVAILLSRQHNERVYTLRGCEDLDSRYRALELFLARNHQPAINIVDPQKFHADLTAKLESSARKTAKLSALLTVDYFPAKFGLLVAFIADNWQTIETEQPFIAEAEQWIEPAMASWPEDFRQTMRAALVHTAREIYLVSRLWRLRRLARQLERANILPAELHIKEVKDFPAVAFTEVLDEELDEIEIRREQTPTADTAPAPHARADQANLAGLAFSGGGIRSATFNLGVLQFLGEKNLLQHFDYLSTVSGGGYIGSWLHAWIHDSDPAPSLTEAAAGIPPEQSRGIHHVEECLSPSRVPDPQDPRAEPIHFLRRYSNYLTPQTGFASADTWTMANIWLRNTFLNVLILALALSAVLLTPRWLASAAYTLYETPPAVMLNTLSFGYLGSPLDPPDARNVNEASTDECIATIELHNSLADHPGLINYWWLLMIPGACLIGLNLASFHRPDQLKRPWLPAWLYKERTILWLIVAPIFVSTWAAGTVVPADLLQRAQTNWCNNAPDLEKITTLENSGDPGSLREANRLKLNLKQLNAPGASDVLLPACAKFAFVTAMLVLLVSITARLDLNYYPRRMRGLKWAVRIVWAYLRIVGITVIASLSSAALAYFWMKTFGVPLFYTVDPPPALDSNIVMQMLTGSAPVFLGLLSITVFLYIGLLGRVITDDRREWLARLGSWLGLCCMGWVAVCGIATYGPGIVTGLAHWISKKPFVGEGGLGAAWILITAAGVLSGRAANPGNGKSAAGVIVGLIAKIAPPVFVIGLLLLLSQGLHVLEVFGQGEQSKQTWDLQGWPAFWLTIVVAVCALRLSKRVDINEFSLHPFYRNRLVRCYLGGARTGRQPGRQPDSFTGFDSRDDFPVSALAPSGGYTGPYPIFNTTLNLAHGDELAWQERKGEAFVFTPRFSGFNSTHPKLPGQRKLSYGGYRPTRDYACLGTAGVSVGTAVAISGAAGSPNQGRQTNVSTAFLMTVLDVRLGWWLGNPRRTDTWQRPGPATGLFQLLSELTANTNDTGKYVNLSDGGFFENLAVYELVRRRCRYIVACDSEQDGDFTFGGLGNLIRKCRTDFGVEIEIDTTKLKPARDARFTTDHFAIGTIYYPAPRAEGKLIYIKSSLTGNESADVLQYAMQCADFPHESTADQWFDETQFESYRKLGFHAAESANLFEYLQPSKKTATAAASM